MGEVLKTGHWAQGAARSEDHRLLIRGGTVWGEDGGHRTDVRIVGGRIAEVGALAAHGDEEVVDAAGLHVLPGMIDVHVHVDDRIGACELADTFPTASEIAVRNGVTTLAGFATQEEGETARQAVERCVARAAGRSYCDFTFHVTPTRWPWKWREIESMIGQGFTTFKLYTTYREAGLFTDYLRLGEVMERLAKLGANLLVHCEDDATLARCAGFPVHPTEALGHAQLRPESVEVTAVEEVLELAARTDCRTHVVHVSTADAAALITEARSRARVSCETAPHYLALDDSSLVGATGYRYLCTPPLRTARTRARMEAAAVAGAFDLFATDHCAFTRADKDRFREDFRAVPKGLAGVGALVPLTFELLVAQHGIALSGLVRRLAANPARLLRAYPRKGAIAPGSDADLVILHPRGDERPVVSSLSDCYETYPRRSTTLAIRRVFVSGREVVRDGAVLPTERPTGRCLAGA